MFALGSHSLPFRKISNYSHPQSEQNKFFLNSSVQTACTQNQSSIHHVQQPYYKWPFIVVHEQLKSMAKIEQWCTGACPTHSTHPSVSLAFPSPKSVLLLSDKKFPSPRRQVACKIDLFTSQQHSGF